VGLALVFFSIWVVVALGITAVWLTSEVRVFGLVMLPTAIVAGLLVVYFDWRAKLRRQVLAERDTYRKAAWGGIVLYTRNSIEHRDSTLAAIVPAAVGIDGRVDDFRDRRDRLAAERAIDDVLADSFPASDPPSWNPGVTRLKPRRPLAYRSSGHNPISHAGERGNGPSDVIDVSRPTGGGRTFLQGLISLAGAAGIALAAPFVILLIGLPVALAVRGLLEAVGWVLGVPIR
jgi:hypothetical protein